MSIELPEAFILAEQMGKELRGKEIASHRLQNHERLQRLGFITKDSNAFKEMVGGKVESATTRGNVIRLRLDNGLNLILAPEYGGTILYQKGNRGTDESSTSNSNSRTIRD